MLNRRELPCSFALEEAERPPEVQAQALARFQNNLAHAMWLEALDELLGQPELLPVVDLGEVPAEHPHRRPAHLAGRVPADLLDLRLKVVPGGL